MQTPIHSYISGLHSNEISEYIISVCEMFGFGLSPPDFDSQLNNRPSVSVPDSGEVLLDNFRFRYKYPDIWTLGTWPSDQFLCLTRIQGSYSYDRRSFHWRPPMRYCHIYIRYSPCLFFSENTSVSRSSSSCTLNQARWLTEFPFVTIRYEIWIVVSSKVNQARWKPLLAAIPVNFPPASHVAGGINFL